MIRRLGGVLGGLDLLVGGSLAERRALDTLVDEALAARR
jgi:hypothetical protein